jgi:hypothetical protein
MKGTISHRKGVWMALWLGALLATLAGCAPAAPGAGGTGSTPVGTATGQGISAGTAMVGTAVPGPASTGLAGGATPPAEPSQTPIPTLAGGLGPSELKYRLLAQFPEFFFCDPDFYPVAHEDEQALALERFALVQGSREEYEAILAHNHLAGGSAFSDQQKLLIYREFKKLNAMPFEVAPGGYRFQIQSGKGEGQGEQITGLIDGQGKITVEERKPATIACPICLAEGTQIETPSGPVAVERLRPGMLVWTVDPAGKRLAQPVEQVGKAVVQASHQMVHLALADGRQLWVSPGHPTADGRRVGELRVGDVLDGAAVVLARRAPYGGAATYDLLPGGETGFYWANGILIASTLKR